VILSTALAARVAPTGERVRVYLWLVVASVSSLCGVCAKTVSSSVGSVMNMVVFTVFDYHVDSSFTDVNFIFSV